jgi:hypothetical protein
MAEVDAKQVNRSSRMKWSASLTFDSSNLTKTGIDEGDRNLPYLSNILVDMSTQPLAVKGRWF